MLDENSVDNTVEVQEQETQKDINFRNLRERAERDRERAELAERRLAQHEREQQAKHQPEQQSFDIDDDTYIEGRKLKQIMMPVIKELQETRAELQKVASTTTNSNAETRLKMEYPDLDHYVNTKNLKRLSEEFPEEYNSILSNPDLYARGKAARNIIKNYGIASKPHDADVKLEENKSKPRSAPSSAPPVSNSPLTRAQDYDRRILTEQRKAEIRQQVAQNKMYR